MNWLLALLALVFSYRAFAYPEMARIGYQNCSSCHVSPSGGGVMTAYGRGMSADILSTWHYEGEEAIGHGLIKGKEGGAYRTPDWLQIGGDSRWIQTYLDNDQTTQKSSFPMQNQLEAALNFGKFWLVGNLNIQGGPAESPNYGLLVSNRLYAMMNVTDEIYARAGKFQVPFGINQPNHMAVIAQGLGFGAESETGNFETGYLSERYNLSVTANFGRPDNKSVKAERGVAVNAAYNYETTHKFGWSLFSGNTEKTERVVTGPYAIVSFTRNLVLLSQADWQWKTNKDPSAGPEQKGGVAFNRLQYEIVQGVHPYVIHQLSYLNIDKGSSRYDSYGTGVMWFPRPHFEIWAEWDKERMLAVQSGYYDTGWIAGHYYF